MSRAVQVVASIVLATLWCAAPAGAGFAPPGPLGRGEHLHRATLLRAAPGRLLELIDVVTEPTRRRGGLLLRHSQGDHWDLMALVPVAAYAEHFADVSSTQPLAPEELIAWQEDVFVRGPALMTLDAEAGLFHVEMFVALAARRADLVREREMENAYLAALKRPINAIFVRELGAAWDAFTVGAYRGWKHYAESEDLSAEDEDAAARAAGFEGSDHIGPYLRTLIQQHHDTLARPVR